MTQEFAQFLAILLSDPDATARAKTAGKRQATSPSERPTVSSCFFKGPLREE
ncbi:MAG TPA: hypothetical protein VEG30_07390 [Terriglobales bacterium]|nr:hypothetical protein [Terriglobales bacterium]